MYLNFFGFDELPFSIVPNARYLYLSQRHQEAIVHLQAGLGDGGGFAMLTGEVGTGKTTVARAILASLPGKTCAGMILNPTFSDLELLEAICDEFEVSYPKKATLKKLTQVLHEFLLAEHAQGIQVLLMIDEAQHLAPDVLEQLRLLTNLETESHKLLKVLLIGQPELQEKLRLPQLRQLAQRITGRYHLLPLNEEQTADYIRFRIEQASGNPELFNRKACQWIAEQTHGIPRLINLVCDAALKQAYQAGEPTLSLARIKLACQEVMSFQSSVYQVASAKPPVPKLSYLSSALGGIALAVVLAWQLPPQLDRVMQHYFPLPEVVPPTEQRVFPQALRTALLNATSSEHALETLYAVWGYQASVLEQFCQTQADAVLWCEEQTGDWSTLQTYDLPAVLTLMMDDVPTYAVLYRLTGDQAELLVGAERYRIARQWLEPLWNGQFSLLWQAGFSRTLKQGMQGADVALLESKLAQVLGEPERPREQFDKDLSRKVELFQRWQNMHVDGIAGRQTLRRLELLTQQQAPSLKEEG
ncbi:TPA: ExeA family protein [Vibrio cholerae]